MPEKILKLSEEDAVRLSFEIRHAEELLSVSSLALTREVSRDSVIRIINLARNSVKKIEEIIAG